MSGSLIYVKYGKIILENLVTGDVVIKATKLPGRVIQGLTYIQCNLAGNDNEYVEICAEFPSLNRIASSKLNQQIILLQRGQKMRYDENKVDRCTLALLHLVMLN